MNIKKFFLIGTLFVGTIGLTACESINLGESFSDEKPQVVASPDTVSAMLADAADRASDALQRLAAIEQKRTPAVRIEPFHDAPPALRRAITVNWIGPVEGVAALLADRAGFEFRTFGSAPPTPVIVSIDAENRPVIEVLRDVGLQLGKRADIRVDGTRNVVELHYAPAPSNPGRGL